jgi:hypothetical protein
MKLVPNAVSTKIARHSLLASKNAPKVLFVGGVAGMVGSTVLACRATLKMDEVLEAAKKDLDTAKSLKATRESDPVSAGFGRGRTYEEDDKVPYGEKEYRHDVVVIYSRTVVKIAREYAPALILGAASIGCITKSHDILTKRNAALTAAYVAIDEAFTVYRERVVDKYGEEQDQEFRYGVEEVTIIDENGKTHEEKRVGPDAVSMYARFFDEYSANWSKEPEYNIVFLHCQQKWANDMLKARGHLFLNEVYDALGLDRTKAGQVVGWVVSHEGDNYVDFGIFKDHSTSNQLKDFVNGREGSILLDFNVDGIIYDRIDHNEERVRWQS